MNGLSESHNVCCEAKVPDNGELTHLAVSLSKSMDVIDERISEIINLLNRFAVVQESPGENQEPPRDGTILSDLGATYMSSDRILGRLNFIISNLKVLL